ncbi:agamous-like MADS-box protein AGL62 [Tripterygium wilfordii]|uniref:agamous-like MADS-box protein AGL62 n=1 Tax=Tripterygium wilfordii TaxID=458696 RepID=UPI0018F7F057|nr:agamous-like MADS-box protein AGL62 [Tripterygium wilfordii]
MVRHTKGRQKIEMKKMTNENNLQVTFSKRRNGVFKKACELSTLCGVEAAIIVFSPGKKAFSFGNPSVEAVVDRFLTGNHPPALGAAQLVEAHRSENIRNINSRLIQVLNELEGERERGEELKRMRRAREGECWWEKPIQEQSLTQLQQLKLALEELKKKVADQAENLMFQNSRQFLTTANDGFDAGLMLPSTAAAGPNFLGQRTLPDGNVVLSGPSESNMANPYSMNTAMFGPNMMPPPPSYDAQGYGHGHGFY